MTKKKKKKILSQYIFIYFLFFMSWSQGNWSPNPPTIAYGKVPPIDVSFRPQIAFPKTLKELH